MPLALRDCTVDLTSGDVGDRGRFGRNPPAPDCFERLPEDVAERRLGVVLDLSEARLAKADDVFSRASDARERRLLLCVRLTEFEW
jgi:hypothetical protein